MKNIVQFIFFTCLAQIVIANGDSLKFADNKAFTHGEKLVYRVHYGIINAGTATFEILKEQKTVKTRPCYHVVGTGKTIGAFNWFFKVRDVYETYIDKKALIPWKFVRDVYEGGYTIFNVIYFDHFEKKLKSRKGTYDVPFGIQDVLSAIYNFRAKDYSNLKPGEKIPVSIFIDEEIFNISILYIGKSIVKTSLGTFRCLEFKPELVSGTVFKEDAQMTVWVTDDENKIPIRIESEIVVGAIQADLKKYSGLKNRFTARIK